MNFFWQNSVFRGKETVSAIIVICFSSLLQSQIKGHTRSILANTASFSQKVCFCRIPKLTKTKIPKPKFLPEIFGWNQTMIFSCPLWLRQGKSWIKSWIESSLHWPVEVLLAEQVRIPRVAALGQLLLAVDALQALGVPRLFMWEQIWSFLDQGPSFLDHIWIKL